MPSVLVKFFGPARQIVGLEEITLEVSSDETVGQLAGRLAETYPNLGAALGIRLAVNRSYVAMNQVLHDGDEVAVIPPVSGGAPLPRIRLSREPLDAALLAAELTRPDAGALITFSGNVRAELDGCKPLLALEYEAYEAMAIGQMQDIRDRVVIRSGVLDAAIWHRLGRIPLGEASILVVVASAHRAAAFEACQAIVDAVKTDVPIWKKNIWGDGTSEWVEPK